MLLIKGSVKNLKSIPLKYHEMMVKFAYVRVIFIWKTIEINWVKLDSCII